MPCIGPENEMLHERYAQVLIDAAEDSGALDEILENLRFLNKQVSENPGLAKALCHPEIEKQDKKALLEEIAKRWKFSEELNLFLRLLVDKNRLSMLHGILLKYQDLYNIRKKRQDVVVESAVSLSKEQIARIKDIFKKNLGKEIIVGESIDSSIIGGLNIKTAGVVYKLSLADRIKYLEEALTG